MTSKFVTVSVSHGGGCVDLLACIDQFDAERAGNGRFACSADDQKMIDQLVLDCEAFIQEHQPHFDWCDMGVEISHPFDFETCNYILEESE